MTSVCSPRASWPASEGKRARVPRTLTPSTSTSWFWPTIASFTLAASSRKTAMSSSSRFFLTSAGTSSCSRWYARVFCKQRVALQQPPSWSPAPCGAPAPHPGLASLAAPQAAAFPTLVCVYDLKECFQAPTPSNILEFLMFLLHHLFTGRFDGGR